MKRLSRCGLGSCLRRIRGMRRLGVLFMVGELGELRLEKKALRGRENEDFDDNICCQRSNDFYWIQSHRPRVP